MNQFPEKSAQIRDAHAGLIHRVVFACNNQPVPDLEQILKQAEDNDWHALVGAIRQILSGNRDSAILNGLDEEDQVIIDSILRGIQDPTSLPPLDAKPDPDLAAPGIASLVHAARSGNTQALDLIANMATQMSQAGGEMARVAAIIRPLSLGERDPNKLAEGMGPEGEKLVMAILAELAKVESH